MVGLPPGPWRRMPSPIATWWQQAPPPAGSRRCHPWRSIFRRRFQRQFSWPSISRGENRLAATWRDKAAAYREESEAIEDDPGPRRRCARILN